MHKKLALWRVPAFYACLHRYFLPGKLSLPLPSFLAVATLDYTFSVIRHLSLGGADGPTPRGVVETASPGAKES